MPHDQTPRSRGRKPREFVLIVEKSDEPLDVEAFAEAYARVLLDEAAKERRGKEEL